MTIMAEQWGCTIRIRHDYMEAGIGAKIDRIRIYDIDNQEDE